MIILYLIRRIRLKRTIKKEFANFEFFGSPVAVWITEPKRFDLEAIKQAQQYTGKKHDFRIN